MSSWLETAIPKSLISKNDAQLGTSGTIWFVATNGNDNNSGLDWDNAFRTIIHAHDIASAGDLIMVGAGIFDEIANGATGVVISKPFLKINGVAPGQTIITNSNTGNNGSVLQLNAGAAQSVVSGFTFQKGETTGTSPIIVKFDGVTAANVIDSAIIQERADSIGAQLTNNAVACVVGSPLSVTAQAIIALPPTTGSIGIDFNGCFNCVATGGVAIVNMVTGVNFNNAFGCAVDGLVDITSCVTGVLLNPGVTGNVISANFTNCVSRIIDNSGNGTNERTNVTLVEPEAHEDMWPVHLGQGVAANPVTITNLATDDTPDSRDNKDYWGNTVAIIAPGAITTRWISNGINIFSSVANKIMRMEFYYPQTGFSTTRNGGNLWDLGETVLTVTNGSIPQAGDKIWIKSNSHPNGEIQLVQSVVGNVVTVASETRASGNTGIRYNHAGAETMYVIERDGLNRLDGHQRSYSAASTKQSQVTLWSVPKDVPPNTGMIGRILNCDDDLAASVQINVIYGD